MPAVRKKEPAQKLPGMPEEAEQVSEHPQNLVHPGKIPLKAKHVAGALLTFGAYAALCRLLVLWGPSQHSIGLLGFLVACFGLTCILVDSAATWPFRQLAASIPIIGEGLYHEDDSGDPDGGLLACALCTGMWIGTLLGGLGLGMFPISPELWRGMGELLVHGFVSAGFCYFTHTVFLKISS